MEVMPSAGTLFRDVSIKLMGRAYEGLVLSENVGKADFRSYQAAKIFTY